MFRHYYIITYDVVFYDFIRFLFSQPINPINCFSYFHYSISLCILKPSMQSWCFTSMLNYHLIIHILTFRFSIFLFYFPLRIVRSRCVEVYKHTIEGSVADPEKYGQEVRNAIRLSRLRVLRGRNRQKVLSERSKNKQFNYFHYP